MNSLVRYFIRTGKIPSFGEIWHCKLQDRFRSEGTVFSIGMQAGNVISIQFSLFTRWFDLICDNDFVVSVASDKVASWTSGTQGMITFFLNSFRGSLNLIARIGSLLEHEYFSLSLSIRSPISMRSLLNTSLRQQSPDLNHLFVQ